MTVPRCLDAGVDVLRFERTLDAQRVRMVVSVLDRRGSEMDDGGVARELRCAVGPRLGEVRRFVERPIRETVERSAIAEDDGGFAFVDVAAFELALHMEDRALRRRAQRHGSFPRKAATEDDACRLGEHQHVLAEVASHRLEHRGLASAGATGEDDETRRVIEAFALAEHDDPPRSATQDGAQRRASADARARDGSFARRHTRPG